MERGAFVGQPWGWTVSSAGTAAAPLGTHWRNFLPVSKPGTGLSLSVPKDPPPGTSLSFSVPRDLSGTSLSLRVPKDPSLMHSLFGYSSLLLCNKFSPGPRSDIVHISSLWWCWFGHPVTHICQLFVIFGHCSSPLSTAKETPPATSPASLVPVFGVYFLGIAVGRTRDSLGLKDTRGALQSHLQSIRGTQQWAL